MMACLDTTVLIHMMQSRGANHLRARDKVEEIDARGDRLVTTRFNIAELFVGFHRTADRSRALRTLQYIEDSLVVLEFDPDCAELFGRIKATLLAQGQHIGDMDVMIASVALMANEPLVTHNVKHFSRIPELVVETY